MKLHSKVMSDQHTLILFEIDEPHHQKVLEMQSVLDIIE